MYIDKKLQFCENQAVTASAVSTDIIDVGTARDLGLMQLLVMIMVTEAATAAGAATVKFNLQCDSDSAFGSAKTVISSAAIPKADLVVGKQVFLPIPLGMDEQHLGVHFEVATGPLTAGKFTAAIVHGEQAWKAYKAQQT